MLHTYTADFSWPTFANKSVAKAMSKHAMGKISNVFLKGSRCRSARHTEMEWHSLFFFFFKLGANAITNDTALHYWNKQFILHMVLTVPYCSNWYCYKWVWLYNAQAPIWQNTIPQFPRLALCKGKTKSSLLSGDKHNLISQPQLSAHWYSRSTVIMSILVTHL